MTASAGKPVRIVPGLTDEMKPWELQEPIDGTLLAVCPDCGFQFDSDHLVQGAEGREGYECYRCLIEAFLKSREASIAEAVIRGMEGTAAPILAELKVARAELEHLRPQNKLLKDCAEAAERKLVELELALAMKPE